MIILAIRTDKPESELYVFDNQKKLAEVKWPAQGILADTINSEIDKILNKLSISASDVGGLVCFKGPGSFTGLRIGLSTGNAWAYAQKIPIVAAKGENWLEQGFAKLLTGQNDKIVKPFYGRPVNITKPKK